MDFEALADLARRQYGVFARWQAGQLGFTKGMIDWRVESGQWVKVMGPSVLAASTTTLSEAGRAWAAFLACGPGATLSGPTAMRRHGLDAPADDKIWVTVPPERHLRVNGVRMIREAVPDSDIAELNGMRVTTVSRSVIDTLRVLPEHLGQPVADRALLRGWITAEQLAGSVETFARRRGNARLRAYDQRARSGARSEAERLTHAILNDAGITGWIADYRIYGDDGLIAAVLDVAFEPEMVAIEIDGHAFHSDRRAFQNDRTRQNWLVVERGWTVVRFTWDDLTMRPGYVVRTIKAELAKHRDATARRRSPVESTGRERGTARSDRRVPSARQPGRIDGA